MDVPTTGRIDCRTAVKTENDFKIACPRHPVPGAGHGIPIMPTVTLDDLSRQLHRFASEPAFVSAFIPRMDVSPTLHHEDSGECARALSTAYRRMGLVKAIRLETAGIIREVTHGDLCQDELVQTYAQQAIGILNAHRVGHLPQTDRDLLTMVAALATSVYSFWTPTIHASGCDGMSHFEVKRQLVSTSWISWWEVRDHAPVIIGKTGGPRSVRTPLLQFLIHMRLRSLDPKTADEQWLRIRSIGCNVTWEDLVCSDNVQRQKFERWMRGAIAIPHGFLSDRRRNLHCIERLSNHDHLHFATLRTIQLLWGLCAKRMPKRHDLLARVFAGVMSIPYEGRLLPSPSARS